MSEQNRILRAMADLGDFTVEDLVRHCEASPSTVRTVLKRNPDRVEGRGYIEAARPGGRWKLYRLRPGALDDVEPVAATVESQVPRDLVAAEEMLLSGASIGVEQPVRSSLLRRAHRRLRHAAADPVGNLPPAVAHAEVVRGLVVLVHAEGKGDVTGLLQAEKSRRKAGRTLDADDKLLADFDERIAASPLQAMISAGRQADRADAREAVFKDMLSVVTKIVDRNPEASPTQVIQTVLNESFGVGRAVTARPVHLGHRQTRRKAVERTRTRKWNVHTGRLVESADEWVTRHG